jgi:DNA-binding protein YbaB
MGKVPSTRVSISYAGPRGVTDLRPPVIVAGPDLGNCVSGTWGGDTDVVLNADTMRQQAAELDEELERVRFTGQSRDGAVTVAVSGHGRLMDLKISAAAVRGAHPHTVGPDVVEAVAAARRQASTVATAKMRAVLDKDQVWQPVPAPPPSGVAVNHWVGPAHDDRAQPDPVQPDPPSTSARPRRVEVEEENFENLDFLGDDGEDEERGRW